MWREDGALVVRADPVRAVTYGLGWGVELAWEEISDVYLAREGGWSPYGSPTERVVFRLARPELLAHRVDRAPRRLARAAETRGLVAVPLSLVNAPREVVVEVIERCWGRPVLDWDESPEEREFERAAASVLERRG